MCTCLAINSTVNVVFTTIIAVLTSVLVKDVKYQFGRNVLLAAYFMKNNLFLLLCTALFRSSRVMGLYSWVMYSLLMGASFSLCYACCKSGGLAS
jgi:hypothetical protein